MESAAAGTTTPPTAAAGPTSAPEGAVNAVLLTGRGSSAQWHTQSRTAKSAILRKLHPKQCWVEIHPQDAQRLGIKDGDTARIVSRRGAMQAQARVTATVQRGQVFLPMHYAEVNTLTLNIVDPVSRQPSYKHCAVKMESVR